MKKIRFLQDVLYESEGRNAGPTFKEGSTHEFEDHFADRWLRRSVAVEVVSRKKADEEQASAAAAPEPPKEEPKTDLGPAATPVVPATAPKPDTSRPDADKSKTATASAPANQAKGRA